MITLPSWLPSEVWAAWLDMRKKCKKPATEYAEKLALKELYKLQQTGQDPVACIEQSILRCWTAFYPVKDEAQSTQKPESFRERDLKQAADRVAQASIRLVRNLNPAPTFDIVDMEEDHARRLD